LHKHLSFVEPKGSVMGKFSVIICIAAAVISCSAQFQIGLGRFDATGPSVEIPFVRKSIEKSYDVIQSV